MRRRGSRRFGPRGGGAGRRWGFEGVVPRGMEKLMSSSAARRRRDTIRLFLPYRPEARRSVCRGWKPSRMIRSRGRRRARRLKLEREREREREEDKVR